MKAQCVHQDSGICETCFNYETKFSASEAEAERLKKELADRQTESKHWYEKWEEVHKVKDDQIRKAMVLLSASEARVAGLVVALQKCYEWVLLGNHEEAPGWIEARDLAQAALASPDLAPILKRREVERKVIAAARFEAEKETTTNLPLSVLALKDALAELGKLEQKK